MESPANTTLNSRARSELVVPLGQEQQRTASARCKRIVEGVGRKERLLQKDSQWTMTVKREKR